MRFKVFLLFILCCFTYGAKAQYGNEWIKSYQTYVKFKIASTGIYKISQPVLQNAGINLIGLNPKRFQLFRNGKEVAIYCHGQNDGVFNTQDYIEFFAQPNDGKFDSILYKPVNKQPHQWFSLFTDTAVYFLTALPDTSSNEGLRYEQTVDENFASYSPEDYVLSEVKVYPTEEYLNGLDYAGIGSEIRYYLSDYDEGEGWASNRIGLGNQRVFSLSTPFKFALGPAPVLECKVIGASNAFSSSVFNHHVQLQLGADNTNFTTIADRTFSGYQVQLFNSLIAASQLGVNTTDIALRVINDLGVLADFNCLSYAKLVYARQLNLGNSSFLYVQVDHHKGAIKSRLQFTNYATGKSNPVVYDLSNNQRLLTVYNAGSVNTLIQNDGIPHVIFMSDSLDIVPITQLIPISFKLIDPSQNYEFIIVSNNKLGGAVNAYQQYRNTKFKTLVVTSEQLYDEYTFGNVHPLAIKRMATYLLKEAAQAPKYLLLAGRGYQNNLARFNSLYYNENLVPAFGVPSSDALFTSAILANGHYAEIPTGRIPAVTEADLANYLAKLIDYETAPDSILPWRKEILHITGGTGLGEQISFKNQFKKNEQTIRGQFFGGNVISFNKNISGPQQGDLRQQILAAQNKGVSLISFYGHASLTILDVDIGNINELNNPRRYPLFYFSGCNVGNANAEDPGATGDVYAKDYICYPNKGAIGWLAHTNFSYTSNLQNLLDNFYNKFVITNYGSSIGNIISEVTKSIATTDPLVRSHNIQWLYQGDPAVVIYSPKLPDLAISSSNIFISPPNASAQLDSFAVGIIISNNAKATNDSIEISLTRTLPDTRKVIIGTFIFKPVLYKDTFYIWVPGKDAAMVGNNTFDVSINKSNGVVESSKMNNDASLVFFLSGQGLQLIEPTPYSIKVLDTINFTIQSNNLFATNNEYIFELDTVINFNSALYKTSGIIKANEIAKWQVRLNNTDTTVYYWRARLNAPVDQGGNWNNGSFTSIKNGASGWTQRKFDQYAYSAQTADLIFDATTKLMRFEDNAAQLRVQIGRWYHSNLGILYPYILNPGVFNCISGGIVCILFNKTDLQPYINTKFPLNCTYPQNTNQYYYTFDTRTVLGQQEFIRFIDSVETESYVAAYSYYDCGSANWLPQMRAAIASIGSVKAAAINNFYSAFTFIGSKNNALGTIPEDTVFTDKYNQPSQELGEVDSNFAISQGFLESVWFTGSLQSPNIGPAKSWSQVSFNFPSIDNSVNDKNVINIIGVKQNGSDTLLLKVSNAGVYSIQNIDAKQFPTLRLSVTFEDSLKRTPNQFGNWSVFYDQAPEGTLSPADGFLFYANSVDQGDSIKINIAFKNISLTTLDSLPVVIEVKNADRQTSFITQRKYASLLPNQFVEIKETISTANMSGNNQLTLTVNKDFEVAERSLVNNIFTRQFEVKRDIKNPMMDVTFDGHRIMNGDFVSPTPLITIQSKDGNSFILQQDTATFDLYVKQPNVSNYERISNNNSHIRFIPATNKDNKALLEYRPERMTDGLYKLRVITKDALGNYSGDNAYEVDYNVINESTITNFFPYPNPCTTNMRFVFTLTGAKVPEDLLVRIMTITGKVIREVTNNEFGQIKIGNNISEFAWDGTDNFGDRVANGVYLYQVQTRINGQNIKERKGVADKFITQGTGKIYLLK